ncbi:hypothetical protein EPR50_G00200540 [Perca flavescens]|uniref:Tectonin beta-propeller repeat-containing protein 2 n=1 Tax=Perca flavescens TaxID=8167 RepID=A0A484C4F2_PERFV|nr:hypothetical protein EPR50_G00200540 [Perca flavescens]
MAAPPSVLREFCPLYYLLNAIPAKVQRGFRSVLVYLTALDSSGDFLAVGSSTGMIYLYCRRRAHLNRYSLEGKSDAITAVKLLSCFDDLVAVGTASGRVAVFQLVSPLPGRNKQLRRLDVVGLHKGSVTSLAWSSNGTKLFSGDDKGRVVFSSLDLDQGVCKPVLLLEESSAVVQMEYRHQSDLQVFAARPGLRLWRSDIRGQVEHTWLLKQLFNTQIPEFELFPRPGPIGAYRPADRQLGLLSCFLRDGWILSWNEYSVYVLDSLNQVLIGALESSGDIVSVSCCDNEIFILKGDRDIIRLSNSPEGLAPNLSEFSVRLSSPLATPTILPPTGSVETAQPIRTMAIIVEGGGREEGGRWERRSEDGEKETEEEGVEEAEEQLEVMEQSSRSRSSSVTSWDSLHSNVTSSLHSNATSCELRRYSAPLSQGEETQDLVVKAIRVKKRRRRQDSTSRLSESSCSDSMFVVQDGSCSDGGTPLSDRVSLVSQDLQNQTQDQNSAEQTQDSAKEEEAESGSVLQTQHDPDSASGSGAEAEAVPPTPDVDLLLECSFSYLHNAEEPMEQPMEQQEEFLSPLIGPEEEMFPSAVSGLDRKQSESSDEDGDIYAHTLPPASSTGEHLHSPSNHTPDTQTEQDVQGKHTPDQLSESWMGFSGPGCGILSLQVTDRHVWCLDFKGGLFCSALPETGLNWQRFEDNVHQVALSPSGNLLWKVEQKSMTAFACAKVSGKGKRHWYKAVEQTAFVALSDDSAWIILTNGDLYLQTGLSVERPCARSVKVDSPCVFSQVCVSGGVVWALSEHKALFYREGLNSFCREGEGWKYDTVSEAQGLDLMCVGLTEGGTGWALDASGSLWFRTGVCPSRPQGDDDHWWQISISDYVVFDQGSLFQTLLQATQSVATVTRAPVERVVAFLSQHSQCQPSLVSANSSGVWVASGRNQLHLARGSLIGTFWQNVVPRGTVSATRWTSIASSAVPHREGTFLWLAQSRKDLFCVWDQDGELRPSSVPLPVEMELTQLSACRDALWGLDTHGRVSIRTLSPSCPFGLHWTPLDLSQLGSVRLVSVSCGSQNVWAVDGRGVVYFRVGTQPLNPSMMLPAWIHIEPPEQPMGVQLVSIQTSPNDRLLWALDNRGSVFVRTGLSDEMPVGTDWELVPGLAVSQLVLSSRTVWVRCANGEVARRYGVSDRNPAGDYWKKIPGNTNWLTVTPEDELWAVTPIGGLSRRLTKLLPQTPCRPAPSGPTLSMDDGDDEWELI